MILNPGIMSGRCYIRDITALDDLETDDRFKAAVTVIKRINNGKAKEYGNCLILFLCAQAEVEII